jgi:hypothetical protein
MSAVEASHAAPVADLQWLPGIEVDRLGRAFPVRAGSAGTSHQSLARSGTLGAAAIAALQAGSPIPRLAVQGIYSGKRWQPRRKGLHSEHNVSV